ncbi:MAG: NAD(P)/FAD-dependent oxidoreductase, partial [Thiohalospira sp.]
TTEEAGRQLVRMATDLVPALGNAPVEGHWAGLRPGSPEGVPLIGPHPELAGLYLNTGHYRNGVVMGPASARLLTDLLMGWPTRLEPTAYRPTAAGERKD